MTKRMTLVLVVLFLGGCRDATESVRNQGLVVSGDFLVPEEELLAPIVELARVLGRLPRYSAQSDFEAALTKSGLNTEPDHYKDGGHFWYLDNTFRSETDPQKRTYRISIGHVPTAHSELVFYYAQIDRVYSAEPWRKTIWQIEWPIETSK